MAAPWDNDPVVGHIRQSPVSVLPLPVSPRQQSKDAREERSEARSDMNDAARLELDRERLRLAQEEALRNSRPFTSAQVADAQQRAGFLSAVERQLGEVERLNNSLDQEGWAGPVYGNIPGTGLDPESSQYDKATTLLTSLIRNVTRTPGEGAMSDYESKLAAATPPMRSDTAAARKQAIDDLRALLSGAKSGLEPILASTRSVTTPQEVNTILGQALQGAPRGRMTPPPRRIPRNAASPGGWAERAPRKTSGGAKFLGFE